MVEQVLALNLYLLIYTHKTLSGSFTVKNKYLEDLLNSKGLNTEKIWQSILENDGSISHLEELSENEKAIFKTAFEIASEVDSRNGCR